MARARLSAEWLNFEQSAELDPIPGNISDFRRIKEKRSQATQEFLKQPAFALLRDKIHVENTHVTLPHAPGHEFPIRIYRPAGANDEKLPVEVFFHGGYWCAGNANVEDLGCRAVIARGNRVTIISFEYRLIPEVDWKTVFSDAENAVVWFAANADRFGGDVSKGFLVGGAEAGAHLAAIAAIRMRDKYPAVKLTGQNLIVPVLLAWPDPKIPRAWVERMPSHMENSDAPLLNSSLFQQVIEALDVPDDEMRKGNNFPMWADLRGLPPAYLAMDECDIIRDQGFLYAELLRDAGVLTRTEYYAGLPNMFVNFPGLPTTLTAGQNLAAAHNWLLRERK